jgi:DNA-binding MarR family transcriptional regulator
MPNGGSEEAVERAQVHRELIVLLQQLSVQSQRLTHAFASSQGLHVTDVEALLHLMHAENAGHPLTTGQLSTALGLSSGATTAVVDRLERVGQLRRDRSESDRRKIHLHYGEQGYDLALQFFRPLGLLSSAVMDQFAEEELVTVRRFLQQMILSMMTHCDQVDASS